MSGVWGRRLAIGGLFIVVLAGAGCTGGQDQPSSSPVPSASTTSAGTTEQSVAPTTAPPKPTRDQPVPKVNRGSTATPTITAKPADTTATVTYPDGVALKVTRVRFGTETDKGPGAFPGRQYAVLTLSITNGSKRALSLDTVVVTVLDKNGKDVSPVYVQKAKVQDFSGTLKLGATATAKYAFAVPKSSRSKVTVVVDFDGVHTSAVFRGGLSQ